MGGMSQIGLMSRDGGCGRQPSRERLFLALWPGAAVAAAMAASWRGAGAVPVADLHMTLAFFGATDPDEKARLMEWAGAVSKGSFTLRLERLAYWEKPGVVVLEPVRLPPAGLRLAERVRGFAVQMGRSLQECRPHVTLARRQGEWGHVAPVAVDWWVEDFVLVRSDPVASPRYTILARWPLS